MLSRLVRCLPFQRGPVLHYLSGWHILDRDRHDHIRHVQPVYSRHLWLHSRRQLVHKLHGWDLLRHNRRPIQSGVHALRDGDILHCLARYRILHVFAVFFWDIWDGNW